MKNQQGAPEALPDPSPDKLRAIARTARNSSGSASDDCGPLAYVLRGWRAAAIAFRAQQAALVDAQQPAPSAAAAVGDEQKALKALHYYMTECSGHEPSISVFHRMVEEALAPQPSPTPQADSQPAHQWDTGYPPLPRPDLYDAAAGTVGWSESALQGFVDADRAARTPADSVTAPAYSIDADPQGIRARVADAITGALAFGAQGANPPPTGHWLVPFWETAREEASRNRPVSSDTLYLLRRLLSNQHTLTGSEFREELTKIVGEAAQAADSVLEDAARYRWLRDQTTDDGIAIVMKNKHINDSISYAENINKYIDAARKQGANHE